EIARRVAGQMAEQIAPQIAGDAHEGEARDPAGKPPQQIVRGDQANEENEREPNTLSGGRTPRQRINKIFHTVLSCDRATDCREHGSEDHGVADRAQPHIPKNKRDRTIDVAGSLVHRFSALLLPQLPASFDCQEALLPPGFGAQKALIQFGRGTAMQNSRGSKTVPLCARNCFLVELTSNRAWSALGRRGRGGFSWL